MSFIANYNYIFHRLQSHDKKSELKPSAIPNVLPSDVVSPNQIRVHNSSPTPGLLSLDSEVTPVDLIPWCVPIAASSEQDVWRPCGTATIVRPGLFITTRHQANFLENKKAFILPEARERVSRRLGVPVADLHKISGFDLAVGRFEMEQLEHSIYNYLTPLVPGLDLDLYETKLAQYFCGWGSHIENIVPQNPHKNDVTFEVSEQPPPRYAMKKFGSELMKVLGPEFDHNWPESHIYSKNTNKGPYYQDSGGGLISLSADKIVLTGIAIQMVRRKDLATHHSLFVDLSKVSELRKILER